MPSLSLVFAGSPAAAVPSLRALASSGHPIRAVITREDAPQGRRGVLTATPVALAAEELGIPVLKANRLGGAVTDAVLALEPDLGVIVAYGGLVREPLLSAPRLGWINLHFSLLPRWRGAAPVQRAIIAGDDLTGASVFQLIPELDAGDLFGQLTQPIGAVQTAGHLLGSLAESGAELLLRVVNGLADGSAGRSPSPATSPWLPSCCSRTAASTGRRGARRLPTSSAASHRNPGRSRRSTAPGSRSSTPCSRGMRAGCARASSRSRAAGC